MQNKPLIRHAMTIGLCIVSMAVAWGSQVSDIDNLMGKAEKYDTRLLTMEVKVQGNSEKLSRVDERTKLILEAVREINRKLATPR